MESSFRPLSRWIGSYTNIAKLLLRKIEVFPAPPEVDRELYVVLVGRLTRDAEFPAPSEVDRELHLIDELYPEGIEETFPAPLEVDRYLYQKAWLLYE